MKRICLILLQAIITVSCFSQNVGIGTTTPVVRLHVAGNQSNLALFDGGNNMFLTFSENNISRGYIGSFAGNEEDVDFGTFAGNPGKVHLTTANIPRLTVLANGNIGIGTTTPQQPFSVAAGMLIDQNNLNTGTVANSLRFGSSSGEAIGSKRNAGTNQYGIDFYTQSALRMTIAHNGNVGIGTNTPTAKLDINGDLNVESKILLNNSAGNNGQVLVSGGSGTPASWRNVALSTNDRFMFMSSLSIMTSGFGSNIHYFPVYSNSSAITYSNDTFTVNKTGFYAVEGNIKINVSIQEAGIQPGSINFVFQQVSPTYRPYFIFSGGMDHYYTFNGIEQWSKLIPFSLNIYLAAGTQFTLYFNSYGGITTRTEVDISYPLSIYLISE